MAEIHSAPFLKEMRKLLLDKRREIVGNIDQGQAHLQSAEGHHLADMEDLASDAADEATAYEILEIERQELTQIDRAFAALEQGTYGICDECEKPIGVERLRAVPFATLCVDCKREIERSSQDDEQE